MEADEEGVTAKNTYGGPLLLRTVFDDVGEETYQYLYNAHGDVVTLLSDGEVAATYYYDSFGNILEQTGEVDNSILYAGYQYDEETGLYYINARMYDPVTARFLQADTYLGNLNDPLSLNLYTYCLNNPHKYADPSGHSVILALLLVAVVSFAIGAGMEYVNQKYIEKRDIINYDLILFEGVFNAVIAVISFGTANIGVAAARQGARSVARSTGRAVAKTMAFGAAEGAANSIGRQLVEGKTLSEIDFGQVAFDTTLNAVTAGISGYHGANQEIFDNARRATKGNVRKNALLSVDADDVADLGTLNGHANVEKSIHSGNSNKDRVLNALRDAPVEYRKNPNTGIMEAYMKQAQITDDYKVILRRDVGDFNHGDLDHWNLEVQTVQGGNLKYDMHLYLGDDGNLLSFTENEIYIPKKSPFH